MKKSFSLEKDLRYDNDISLYDDISVENTIEIDKDNITIDGNGYAFDGNGDNRILKVTGKEVVLKNLIFKNAKAPTRSFSKKGGYGGAIFNKGKLKLINCEFINNSAKNNGYDILNTGELTLENCKFSLVKKGKDAIHNDGLIKASDSEKSYLEPFISNPNKVKWHSNVSSDSVQVKNPDEVISPEQDDVDEHAIQEVSKIKEENEERTFLYPSEENKKYDAFISFKTDDNAIAHEIYEYLENRNIKCWMSEKDLGAGVNFGYEIVEAIENSKCVILVYSKNTPKSKWVKRELYHAAGADVYIFPVIVDDSKIIEKETGFIISSHNWLFLNRDNKEESFEQIYEFFKKNL